MERDKAIDFSVFVAYPFFCMKYNIINYMLKMEQMKEFWGEF